MLNRNFANSTANIGLAAAQKAVLPQNQPNLADVVANGVLGYKAAKVAEDEQMKRQAYVDALASGNQDAVNQAWAQYDPDAYAARQAQLADQEQARQWDLEDMARKEQFERELAAIRHRNAMETAAARGGEGITTAMRNISYLQNMGYSPEEAAQLYYSGNNPTLNMAAFGKKGTEALDKKLGENYAEDLNTYNNLVANLPTLQAMVDELDALAGKGTHTTLGRIADTVLKEGFDKTSSGALASAAYQAKVNQNLLPLLRQTLGAAFTEKDREELIKTLGDPYATPAIKKDTLKSFITNKQREIESKKRKLDSYNQGNNGVIDASEYFKIGG